MGVMLFFLLCAAMVIVCCLAIMAFVFYKWRSDDVISIDDVDFAEFKFLKKLSKDKAAMKQIEEEYNAGVYNDI